MSKIEQHYNRSYFEEYQRNFGEIAGVASTPMLQSYIMPEDKMLDFGCGGGFILKNLNCKHKVGVELNPIAREYCISTGINCVASLSDVDDESSDVVILNHCLEHTPSPQEILVQLHKKLRTGGKAVIVVPIDSQRKMWKREDIDFHLYSFSPMNLGNLMKSAGFQVLEVKPIYHKFPPKPALVKKVLGLKIFHLLSNLFGVIDRRSVQVQGIAMKS